MREPRSHRIRRPQTRAHPHPGALDDLRFMRETMARSVSFTAVPGWGQVAMGSTALAASFVANRQQSSSAWLQVWLAEAMIAAAIAVIAMQIKARRTATPLTSGPGRKFAFSFLPPLAAGAILTSVLYRAGLSSLLPGTWMLLYGVGVVTAGAFSVSIVPVMGSAFMLTGVAALLVPAQSSLFMAAGFGGLHLIFGTLIARRHGG